MKLGARTGARTVTVVFCSLDKLLAAVNAERVPLPPYVCVLTLATSLDDDLRVDHFATFRATAHRSIRTTVIVVVTALLSHYRASLPVR